MTFSNPSALKINKNMCGTVQSKETRHIMVIVSPRKTLVNKPIVSAMNDEI